MKPNSQPLKAFANAYLMASTDVTRLVGERCLESILEAAVVLAAAFRADSKILLCGNGGSAADCQHLAAEFMSRLRKNYERRPLPAVALTTDTSFLTAFGNDYGFEGVFERQVQALGKPGDVLIAISTSGDSDNVIRATTAAQKLGMPVVALTGESGRLACLADIVVAVPSSDTQLIQQAHLTVEHLLACLVECQLFGDSVKS